MTQLVPDEWNEWDHAARVGWWDSWRNTLPWCPDHVLNGEKIAGTDTWLNPSSGLYWTLNENPWKAGTLRWDVTEPKDTVLYTWGQAWARRRSEQMKHEQRDSVKSLREAEEIITGDRYNDYGPPAENFGRIATYWNQYLKDNPPPLKPSDTAMLMVFVKIAREAAGHKTDSVVDAEGYLAIYEELRNKEILEEETETELHGGN